MEKAGILFLAFISGHSRRSDRYWTVNKSHTCTDYILKADDYVIITWKILIVYD